MTFPVGGIDPHQDTFTVGIVDCHGVETCCETFANTAAGYGEAIGLLGAHGVERVGVEGSAKWGAHVAIALAAAGFDAREVPASRSAAQRRSRRLDKTDAADAVASARALLAEPTLGPVQALEAYDPLVAEIEAVLEHRRGLVAARTLTLHHVADQISKLPTEIRDQLTTSGKIESRLRRLEHIDPATATTPAGAYRLGRLQAFIGQDRAARSEIRRLERLIEELLDQHGTTLRDEHGIGPIAAATLVCEVGDPRRFDRESKFARWSGHRRRRALIRRRQLRPRQAPARLQRQPAHQLGAPHRVGHPAAQPARRRRVPRPQSHRGQDPTRSPTSPQTTTRQPSHPPNAARRKHPTTATCARRLTRERPTDPTPVPNPARTLLPFISRRFSRQPAHVAQLGQSRDLLSPRSQVRILPWALPTVFCCCQWVCVVPHFPSVATVFVRGHW